MRARERARERGGGGGEGGVAPGDKEDSEFRSRIHGERKSVTSGPKVVNRTKDQRKGRGTVGV